MWARGGKWPGGSFGQATGLIQYRPDNCSPWLGCELLSFISNDFPILITCSNFKIQKKKVLADLQKFLICQVDR
jgi:hypothetical protein